MNDQELDLDDLDNLLEDFDGITVEGGTDPENNDDGCEGGACKIWPTRLRFAETPFQVAPTPSQTIINFN